MEARSVSDGIAGFTPGAAILAVSSWRAWGRIRQVENLPPRGGCTQALRACAVPYSFRSLVNSSIVTVVSSPSSRERISTSL